MAALTGFTADPNATANNFDPLPDGKYRAAITESGTKTTNDGTGEYLKLTFSVLDGDHKGRKLWVNLNLWHRSEEARKFSRAELSLVCKAAGRLAARDSEELHGIPMILDVRQKRDKDGEVRNVIKQYLPDGPVTDARPPSAFAPPASPLANTPFWLGSKA
jgi:hypothetical protein